MTLASTPGENTGYFHGRRKQIPFLVAVAVLWTYIAASAGKPAGKLIALCVVAFNIVYCYRLWTVPVTRHYKEAKERRKRWRSTKIAPKVVVSVIAGVCLFYAALFAVVALGR